MSSGDAAAAHGCVNNRCILVGYTSCKHAKQAGQNENGIYNILVGGNVVETYCDQQTRGGGWTMVMRVSDYDNSIDFRHGGGVTAGGQGWNSRGYSTVRAANADSCSGPVRGCRGTDFVHPTCECPRILSDHAACGTLPMGSMIHYRAARPTPAVACG